MNLLTKKVKDYVENTQLCYVASVNDDGTPSLSPKGSLMVLDNNHLVFANISSKGTIENLRKRPFLEINIVNIFKRIGFGISGTTEIMEQGTDEYDFVAKPLWKNHGTNFPVHNVVKIKVLKVREFRSPAYEYGNNVNEESLTNSFLDIYTKRIIDKKK